MNLPDYGPGVEFLAGSDGLAVKYLELVQAFGETDVIVLSPFKGKEDGVHDLNARLRVACGLNDPRPGRDEIVMCARNAARDDDDEGPRGLRLLNGMRLTVAASDYSTYLALCRVGSNETATVPYKPHAHGPAEHIVWGRAATVHKFQGSEAAAVIVVIPPNALKLVEKEPLIFDAANFYTAVSRAKKRVVIMGALDQLPALMKHGTRKRITTLEGKLALGPDRGFAHG
jgi:ATP-dependent exoDNAse (exonuclease V) alpha subunit